jgi:manganese transport protein
MHVHATTTRPATARRIDRLPGVPRVPGDPGRPARRRPGGGGLVKAVGPAFVAAIAYVDPGNFATNFAGGSSYGYALLWVVVAANAMAVLTQGLAARLGLVTGRNLAQLCRERLPRPLTRALWVQTEAVMMATDVAEVVGGALALHLLFGVAPLAGGALAGAAACALVALHGRSQSRFERVVGVLLLLIVGGFVVQLMGAHVRMGGVGRGLVPTVPDTDALVLASAIVGATVMPHAIHLHSDLARGLRARTGRLPLRRVLTAQYGDIGVALGLAGLVNVAMLLVAAALLFGAGMRTESIEGAYAALGHVAGPAIATVFALALLTSGLASSGVGTFAGQVVMDGFLRRGIPPLLRRVVTLLPALVVLALGVDLTRALVVSQVVLSVGVPSALVPLIVFAADRRLMGRHAIGPVLALAASAVAVVVIGLNVALVGTVLL